jgi:hypothetical protein
MGEEEDVNQNQSVYILSHNSLIKRSSTYYNNMLNNEIGIPEDFLW